MSRLIPTTSYEYTSVSYKEVYVCSYKVNVTRSVAKSNIKPTLVDLSISWEIKEYTNCKNTCYVSPRAYDKKSGKRVPLPTEGTHNIVFPDYVGIFTTMEECRRYYGYLVSQAMTDLDKYYEKKKQRLLRTTKLPTKY